MELSVVVKFNQIVTTMILIVVLTTCVHFQEVQGLPIRVSRSALEPPLGEGSRDLDGGAEERVISKGNVRVGRDIGPGLVKENETAASVIYHANEQLIRDFPDWLVEMDIVKSPLVEEFRRSGVDDHEQFNVNGDGHGREKKATFNIHYHSYLYWPNARVPYSFHPNVEEDAKEAVRSAMDVWMAHTCIEFVPVESDEVDYIEFIEMYGCWSYVGKQGGDQKVSIGVREQPFCKYRGVLLHEIGHALGFFHEQTRPDRDSYVQILWQNMISSAYLNFVRYSSFEVDSMSVPYDYASIMHYPRNAFTKNGMDTIIPLQPGVNVMGQRNSLSPLDIKQANLLYQCQRWLNQTEISDDRLNLINLIPGDAFQIQNAKTNSCLTASTVNNKNNTYPDSDDNVNTPTLYHISMIECNSSHPQHFWQWTDNDTILNVGTYLCLTTIDGSEGPDSNQDSSEVEWLVLMPCVESDERQIWSCSGQYIQQPSSGKCLTTGEQSKEDDEENESSEERRRRRRNTDLKQIMEELGQFLNDVDDSNSDDLEQSTDTSSESHTTISDEVSHQALQEQTVWVEYCKLQNELQMWAGVTKHSDDTSTVSVNNENSICSQIGTTQHTLPRCYANDMTSISQVTSLTDYFAVEWITCNKHSYYVTGFYHTHVENSGTHVRDGLFTGMQCCATRSVFTGEPESPLPDDHADDCDEVEWWSFQDVLISEGWFLCPKGKFLKGFKIGPSLDHTGVHRIYKANCCRSHSASDVYEHCYTDTSRRLDNTGVHTCRMEGYLVTAMYLDRCVEGDGCTEKLTCCIEA